MFGNNKDSKPGGAPSTGPAAGGGVNTIDAQTSIVGDLKAGGDIRIDGQLKGNLDCQAKLIIGPKGSIDGDVVCRNATIEGRFTGNLVVKDMLTLKESAQVQGDIKAKKMAALAGYSFSGTCTVPYEGGSSNGQAPKQKAAANPLKTK